MKSPSAFQKLSLNQKLLEVYNMARRALVKNNSYEGTVTIPTPPESGTYILKSVEGVLTWESEPQS